MEWGWGHIGYMPSSGPQNETVGQPRVSSVMKETDFRVQRSHLRWQLPSEHKANMYKMETPFPLRYPQQTLLINNSILHQANTYLS